MSPLVHYGCLTAWISGHADAARERMSQMLASTSASNPYELALSRSCAAEFLVMLREYEQAKSWAVRALQIAEKHEFAEIIATSTCYIGWAGSHLGSPTEGVALIRQGLAKMLEARQGQDHHQTASWACVLAEAQHRAGSLVEALETINRALHASRDVPWRREILRINGELQLANGQTELAEAEFRKALELARSMGAKSWELRTIMSLARLLDHEGRCEESRLMLAEIYGWFTEGFDTSDLKDAKALLEELAT